MARVVSVKDVIDSLKDQQRDRLRLAGGDKESIFTHDAAMLAEAVKMLEKQVPALIIHRDGWPDEGRDTVSGNCPVCGNLLRCIIPRYANETGFYCSSCGQRIKFTK